MNIRSDNLETMLCIRHISPQNDPASIESTAVHALAETGAAVGPTELGAFLGYLERHGRELSRSLAAGMDELQELFLRTVHQSFQAVGVEADARMTLYLNQQDKLALEGASPGQEKLLELLSASKALPAILKMLSVQNALLRNITELRLAAGTDGEADPATLAELRQNYRVCLKGPLSHFYSL